MFLFGEDDDGLNTDLDWRFDEYTLVPVYLWINKIRVRIFSSLEGLMQHTKTSRFNLLWVAWVKQIMGFINWTLTY